MRMRVPICLSLLAVLTVCGAVAAAEIAAAENPAAASDAAAREYEPVTVLGMQVFIDRETGAMRPPTPEEAAELSSAMSRLFAGLAPQRAAVEHADGTVSIELGLQALDFSVARVDEHGKLVYDCADHAGHALELVEAPVAMPEEE